MTRLLSIQEVTAILGISRSTLYRLAADGKITFTHISQRRVGVRSDLVEAIMSGTN